MKLSPFAPPSLVELRHWWRTRDEQAAKRLILEIQRYRLELLEMRDLIDSGVREARVVDPKLVKAGEPLMTLRIRIAQEVLRVGDTPPHDRVPKRVRDYARSADSLEYELEGARRRQAKGKQ
jgi:hypothetical protein